MEFQHSYQLAVSVSTVIVFRGDKILSGAFKFRQSNLEFLGGIEYKIPWRMYGSRPLKARVKELERAP